MSPKLLNFLIGGTVLMLSLPLFVICEASELELRSSSETQSSEPIRLSSLAETPVEGIINLPFNSGIFDLRPRESCAPLNGMARFYCPSPDNLNPHRWKCIRSIDLCNRIPDCPQGEDEQATFCLFYSATRSELKHLKNLIAKYIVRDHKMYGSFGERGRR